MATSSSTPAITTDKPVVPKDSLPMMVYVTAPASLSEGYTFEAQINGDPSKIITCTTPPGGVQAGQSFLVELPQEYAQPRLQAPTGRWKDGLCGCFSEGIFHPSLWCSWCCAPIAMGQIMSRMKLTWLGEKGPMEQTKQAFKITVALFVTYVVVSNICGLATSSQESLDGGFIFFTLLRVIGSLIFTIWFLFALYRTRKAVREQYRIPEENCIGCEDLCCSLWCGCCTIAQMQRHTGEYETYEGICCSKTGHKKGTPETV